MFYLNTNLKKNILKPINTMLGRRRKYRLRKCRRRNGRRRKGRRRKGSKQKPTTKDIVDLVALPKDEEKEEGEKKIIIICSHALILSSKYWVCDETKLFFFFHYLYRLADRSMKMRIKSGSPHGDSMTLIKRCIDNSFIMRYSYLFKEFLTTFREKTGTKLTRPFVIRGLEMLLEYDTHEISISCRETHPYLDMSRMFVEYMQKLDTIHCLKGRRIIVILVILYLDEWLLD